MEALEKIEKLVEKYSHKHRIQKVEAHSYSTYFAFFLFGIILDIIFRFRIFSDYVMVPVGLFFLIVATILIFWAQKTGRDLEKEIEEKVEHLYRGPFSYTRSPTHWGLFFLMLGYGIIANSVFVILFTLISFLFTRYVFLEKREKIMTEKYGDHFLEYKKKVKL